MTYTVTVEARSTNSAKTGFVIIKSADCPTVYHTEQLGVVSSARGVQTQSITFKLLLTDSTDIEFVSHWGTSSNYTDYQDKGANGEYYITDAEEIKMIVNGKLEPPAKKTPETTSVPETTSTPETTAAP